MKVPSLKWTPTHSPSAGQSAVVALVSGPRTVRSVRPASRVTTITQLQAAIDRKAPARSLWLRQTRSMTEESDGRSSNVISGALCSRTMLARFLSHRPRLVDRSIKALQRVP